MSFEIFPKKEMETEEEKKRKEELGKKHEKFVSSSISQTEMNRRIDEEEQENVQEMPKMEEKYNEANKADTILMMEKFERDQLKEKAIKTIKELEPKLKDAQETLRMIKVIEQNSEETERLSMMKRAIGL